MATAVAGGFMGPLTGSLPCWSRFGIAPASEGWSSQFSEKSSCPVKRKQRLAVEASVTMEDSGRELSVEDGRSRARAVGTKVELVVRERRRSSGGTRGAAVCVESGGPDGVVVADGLRSLSTEQDSTSPRGDGSRKRTLYLVDVHPLCYQGKKPRPSAILNWMKLLFSDVTLDDPVIAVMDGERGNEYRRELLPSYKANRNVYRPLASKRGPYYKDDEMDLREAFPKIQAFLAQCNVPVFKIEDAEADDVVATLMQQAISNGMRVVVASPDMDFRQLLSENVQMLLPLPEFGRWSFYTLQQYLDQNSCDPSLDLGLRCILGDPSDCVPGLPDLAPGFGRKTALKLMKKHGSLENLLTAAKTRTVGKPYIQDALTQHADALYRNLKVLKLRRDVGVTLKKEWCIQRDKSNDVRAFRKLEQALRQ